jgi:tetratricopeptide (TPR) repeat protein
MKRKLDELRENLGWFVEQRDELVLVLDIVGDEVAYVLKMLDVVEQGRPGDVFLLFAHPLEDLHGYMAALMANVKTQIDGANALRRQDGLEPWPELPSRCLDPRVRPSDRIKALLDYVRDRLPEGDHHVVLGLLPTALRDAAAYAEIVGGLIPRRGLEPWMARTRIILRDDRSARFLIPSLGKEGAERVLFYQDLDLSPDGLVQSLVDEAGDPAAPEDDRLTALVQLAALDYSHGRFSDSIRKWGVLFEAYVRKGNIPMQALCLGGVGDVFRRMGNLPEAKKKYQQGLALAQDLSAFPVALNLLIGVGEVCIQREEWEEAEGYLSIADQLASKLCLVYPKCDIMDRHGLALLALGRTDEAHAKWRATVDVSREVQHYGRCESALNNLIRLYDRARMHTEARAHRRELEEVERERHAAEAQARALRGQVAS